MALVHVTMSSAISGYAWRVNEHVGHGPERELTGNVVCEVKGFHLAGSAGKALGRFKGSDFDLLLRLVLQSLVVNGRG